MLNGRQEKARKQRGVFLKENHKSWRPETDQIIKVKKNFSEKVKGGGGPRGGTNKEKQHWMEATSQRFDKKPQEKNQLIRGVSRCFLMQKKKTTGGEGIKG